MPILNPFLYLDDYNTAISLAQENQKPFLVIVYTALILNSLTVLFLSYLLYKTSKVNHKSFFLLVLGLLFATSVLTSLYVIVLQ